MLAKTIAVTAGGSCRRLHNRVRQYGALASGKQLLRVLVRRAYGSQTKLVFVMPDFSGYAFQHPGIVSLTNGRVTRAVEAGELSAETARLLSGFLAEGSAGICAEVDGCLAGYAWVQRGGEYRFGYAGRLMIPPGYAVAKNLFVFPKFRGKRLARKLNEARLTLIPAGTIPVVLIIPDNRYAIRNWEPLGFRRVAEVTHSRWMDGPWQTSIRTLADLPEATPIISALQKAEFSGMPVRMEAR
ncbi:MAG: GNAT family N-acetyltransferase [Planctomycetales bacterium]|nr:GNAT family N-acetyltransferase [Planctomycetales bacterium]NIM09053.1 GNAT family N-acetyltransferase [Planctomycetales bacterium]NIN08516.1 GNAT family N-acetyltransferase [Planctomycetales bacterium]NIN77650.1 GNAT family N-acetyltransferase [Planctomycetales bacterium]NIO34813.1 GNAT family N-acetyltransferase [Planctomycetales bacterium]